MKKTKNALLLALVIIVLIIGFKSQYDYQLDKFERSSYEKKTEISQYIEQSRSFIELMTIYGNNYLNNEIKHDNVMFDKIKYNETEKYYSIDSIENTIYRNFIGNITGIGLVPTDDLGKRELKLALEYNLYFDKMYKQMPEIAWLYYTSESNFVNMYPWVASKDFKFNYNIMTAEFYTVATKENNPSRQCLWTTVYLDHAGKGLMVSLSGPIYYKQDFRGTVSLDLTVGHLREVINSNYESYLIDEKSSIIVGSENSNYNNEVITITDYFKATNDEIIKMRGTKNKGVQVVRNHFIYYTDFDSAPWRMMVVLPVWKVILTTLFYNLPILFICLLLLFVFNESNKRRITEKKLLKTVEELKSYQYKLENAAKYDYLTSIYNRRGFEENFNKLIDINNSKKSPVCFVIGDIDNFKIFNDTYGHSAGDRVLIEISKLMKESLGKNELVCRWGGEEFLIMLYDKDYREAIKIAEYLRQEIANITIPWEDGIELKATMTFGVAEYDYEYSFDKSISMADDALYVGKKNGRNQVVGYLDIG